MGDLSDFRSEEQNSRMTSKDLSLPEGSRLEEQKPNILSENLKVSKDFRFKEQHPNIPSKNPSLSKERWEELKPMISNRVDQGVPISEILRQLSVSNIHVTRSQFNTQTKKWGLAKYNVQLLRGARGSLDLPITVRVAPETQIPNSNTEAVLIDKQVPIGGSFNDFEASTLEQLEGLELEAHSIDQAEATGASRLQNGGLGNLVGEPASDTAAREPETSDLGRSVPADGHSAPRLPRSTFADETHTSDLQPEVTTCPRLELPSYKSTSIGLEYRHLRAVGWVSDLAELLFNMKCYTEAFEIFFLIISELNTLGGAQIETSCYFLFFAMCCVRSAWTREQKTAAEDLVPKLHRWVEAVQQYADPDTIKCMREVLQVGVKSLEVETLEQAAHRIVGSTLPLSQLGFSLSIDTRIPGPIASPSAAIAYFYTSDVVQYTIRHALIVIKRFLRKRNA
ncbi:uncharacterized protein Z520_03966 [Fonsecaea multimorphosa CBS 102226]|uniref:Clr5 domain-containing protein n=1 Tax=Fonsecaea multimorphosa CBS 102226 TaxID=1442371 RepID=A0A0D2HEG6_9EURO|nr:uncharacterized protein Z520_03966 [Fonsecaea multimorphosa CBS 102226]KIY00281.1 hypothetical protein Z520_03966 [Fonsecaea multimorphosa CBS 102226]OAL27114.1 hypothetical protein AYO22_03745 [Fonsecaea multimorphosa]